MTKKTKTRRGPSAPVGKQSRWALPIVGFIVLAFIIGVVFVARRGQPTDSTVSDQPNLVNSAPTAAASVARPTPELLSMEVAKAVMVTVELNFPEGTPTIAEALTQIERRYQPDDGLGRTFAILDAYGEGKPDGKLHMSMHVSSEKPGLGSLVFRRTGEVLWNSRITPTATALGAKNLTISVSDESGASWIIDGSGDPTSILDAKVRDKGIALRDFWPDGAERELTLVYSACGCPVKVMARRAGERTVRTKDLPVIFPDDPAAVQTIARLMRW